MKPASSQWTSGTIFYGLLAVAGVLLLVLGLNSLCTPGTKATLTEESRKDPACGREIQAALETLRNHLGMSSRITEADVEAVLSRGSVVKSYTKDGIPYKMTMALRIHEGACKLMVVKEEKRERGRGRTSWGNYGEVKLTTCHCQR